MTERQVAVVTGAASGIGRALANELLDRGALVVLADMRGDAVAVVAHELDRNRGQAFPVTVDVRDHTAVEAMVDDVYSRYGRLDLLFNNAGLGAGGDFEEFSWDHWDNLIDVNIRGVIAGIHAVYPRMVARRSGYIINTASMAGLVPTPLLAPYVMTKHAIVGLSLSLRAEAALHGVRVSVLCPGPIETPIYDTAPPIDLPLTSFAGHARAYLEYCTQRKPYPADKFAKDVLQQVEKNRAVIISPRSATMTWWAYRWRPGRLEKLGQTAVAWSRAQRRMSRSRLEPIVAAKEAEQEAGSLRS